VNIKQAKIEAGKESIPNKIHKVMNIVEEGCELSDSENDCY
jgi:hypothetical protein